MNYSANLGINITLHPINILQSHLQPYLYIYGEDNGNFEIRTGQNDPLFCVSLLLSIVYSV